MNIRSLVISLAILLAGPTIVPVAAQKSVNGTKACIGEGLHCTATDATQCCSGHSCRGKFRTMTCQKD
jgi:hypothetical protein